MSPIQKKAELSPRTVNKIARMGGMKHGSALDLQEKMEKKNAELCAPVLQRPSLCHFTTHPAGCALQRLTRTSNWSRGIWLAKPGIWMAKPSTKQLCRRPSPHLKLP
jgi:hypothetical protein